MPIAMPILAGPTLLHMSGGVVTVTPLTVPVRDLEVDAPLVNGPPEGAPDVVLHLAGPSPGVLPRPEPGQLHLALVAVVLPDEPEAAGQLRGAPLLQNLGKGGGEPDGTFKLASVTNSALDM